MHLRSRLNYFFILFRLILLTFLTPLALLLPYVIITQDFSDGPVSLYIFLIVLSGIGFLGVFGEIYTYRFIFPKIVITERGVQKRNFLGLGFRQYYDWTQLSGYDTSHISLKGASAGVVKIFRNKRCVIEFNAVVYANFNELSKAVEQYLNRYPDGPRIEES